MQSTLILSGGNILLPSLLSFQPQSCTRDSDFSIILQTYELDFNSITRANLYRLLPDSHRKWAYSLWMVCAHCRVLQRNQLALCSDTSLGKATGLRHVSQEKVRPKGETAKMIPLHPHPNAAQWAALRHLLLLPTPVDELPVWYHTPGQLQSLSVVLVGL